MIKKMTMLAMAVGALVAFAVPATASAVQWTDNESPLTGKASQAFEGRLEFSAGGGNSFDYIVTVEIEASAGDAGVIKKYNPTTSSCTGTGGFAGCVLTSDVSNIIEEEEYVWGITLNSTNEATITKVGGNLTLFHTYHGCAEPKITATHLEFERIKVTPTLNSNGTITSLAISGKATNGALVSGSLAPEGSLTLGID